MNRRSNQHRHLTILLALCGFMMATSGCDEGETIRSTRFGEAEISGAFLFSKTAPGQSEESVVRIRNVGDADLLLAEFDADLSTEYTLEWFHGTSVDAARQLGIDNGENVFPRSVTVEPDEVVTLVMTYTPRTDRAPRGRLFISSNAASDELREIVIPVRGLSRNGELVVNPHVIDLGRVEIGQVATKTVTVSNIGQVAVNLSEIAGYGSARFSLEINGRDPVSSTSVIDDPDGDGEPGLAPGGSFDVVVVHQAEFDRPDAGELRIISDAINGDLSLPMRANSESPCVRIDPALVDFGAAGIGQSSVQFVAIESCGGDPLRIDEIEIIDGRGDFVLTEGARPPLPAMLPAADLQDPSGRRPRFLLRLNFDPQEERVYDGALRIVTNDPYNSELIIELNGRGVHNECPHAEVAEDALNVRPLDIITLDGSPSIDVDGPDGRPVQYLWTIVERPMGSTAQVVERFDRMNQPAEGGSEDVPNTPTARFFVDLAGTYIFELQVVDNRGARAPSDSCEQTVARIVVNSVPEHDVHIQLVWDTPGDLDQTDDQGADVDLHLTHPNTQEWFNGAGLYDCYFANIQPNWGALNDDEDDPSLDIDDTNGAGPENINLNSPENTTTLGAPYRVGVHYFRASVNEFGGEETWGASDATVRVYVFGELRYEGTRQLETTNDFWEVVSFDWNEEGQEIIEIDRITQKVP